MVGLSDAGLYQRSLLVMEANLQRVSSAPYGLKTPQQAQAQAQRTLQPPFVTFAFDLQQKLWVARGTNAALVKDMMAAVSGTARTENASLILESPKGDLIVDQYFYRDAPKHAGKAFRGMQTQVPGRYAFETYWERYDDPTIMAPLDRFMEMLDRATRAPRLMAMMREQFGGMVSIEALLMFGAPLLALMGAEFVGGKIFALAVTRLLGLNQLLCDFDFYAPRLPRLYDLVNNARDPKDLEEGGTIIAEVLCQLLVDIAAQLGIKMLTEVATRLFRMLMNLSEGLATQALREAAGRADKYLRTHGYKGRELLKNAADSPLEPASISMYKQSCVKQREILVVREPDVLRSLWIKAVHVYNNAKPMWLKAKSSAGWHGLVCLTEAEAFGLKGKHMSTLQQAPGMFDLGNFKGVSPEIDAIIAEGRYREMYDLPTDGRDFGAAIDYEATGKNNVNLKGHKLVDAGEGKYIIVDALGRPYVSDLDLATRQQVGTAHAGDHIQPHAPPGRAASPEDNIIAEFDMNQMYWQAGGHPFHAPNNHGGKTGSVGFEIAGQAIDGTRAAAGLPPQKRWKPKEADGSWKKERLIVFLPELVGGRVESKMYAFDGWGDFKKFAELNNFEFPW